MEHRAGKKRALVYAYMEENRVHPSAQTIFQALKPVCPQLSLATVYRSLERFREEGRVFTAATVDGEERYDITTVPHQHFVCERCKQVTDISITEFAPRKLADMENQYGVRIKGYTVVLTGICHACQNHEKEA